MDKIFATIGVTPVVLLNTTVFRAQQKEVNAIIDQLVEAHPNATLVDWAAISAVRSVRGGDGIHPSPAGRVVLATAIARAAGIAPSSPGDCMKVYFQDDSRVLRDVMPSADETTMPTQSTAAATNTSVPVTSTTTVVGATTVAPGVSTTVAAATPTTAAAPTSAAAPVTTVAAAPTSSVG